MRIDLEKFNERIKKHFSVSDIQLLYGILSLSEIADTERAVGLKNMVSPEKGRTTVIFYNEDQTKNITFFFTEENDTWDIKVEFNPELNMEAKDNELYQSLASRFIDIIKK